MRTRSAARRIKQMYRSRVKKSHCRGRTRKCTRYHGCKRTRSGRRTSYCRKLKNHHI